MIRRSAFTFARNYRIAWAVEILGWLVVFPILWLLQRRRSGPVRDILVVRLDNLGDVLLATPAIHALRHRYPDGRVTCLVKSAAAEILRDNPDVDDMVFFDAPWYPQDNLWFLRREARRRFWLTLRELRRRNFDLAVHLKPFKYHADLFLMALTGAPRRTGFAHKGGAFLLSHVVPQKEEKHVVQSALDVARHLGASPQDESLLFVIPNHARQRAAALLTQAGLETEGGTGDTSFEDLDDVAGADLPETAKPRGPLVCLNPTASHKLIWTEEGFATVARWLVDELGARVFFVGMPQDVELIERIRAATERPTASLTGRTNVATLAAAIERADLVVSVDSLARHLASAVGTPVVFLRNGANPNVVIGPYGRKHWMVSHPVDCAPCGLTDGCEDPQCMLGITPDEVIAEVREHLPEILG